MWKKLTNKRHYIFRLKFVRNSVINKKENRTFWELFHKFPTSFICPLKIAVDGNLYLSRNKTKTTRGNKNSKIEHHNAEGYLREKSIVRLLVSEPFTINPINSSFFCGAGHILYYIIRILYLKSDRLRVVAYRYIKQIYWSQ